MALKALLSKAEFDKLADALKGEYKADGDNFILDVDDKDYKGKLDEFRGNNKKLTEEKKQLLEIAERFKGIDPDKYTKAITALEKLEESEDSELLKAGKVDEVVKKRTGTMTADFEKRLKEAHGTIEKLTGVNGTYKTRLQSVLVENSTTKALSKIGAVKASALEDVYGRATRDWSVDDDGVLKSKNIFNGKGDPMNMDEWATKLLQDAPHLFEPSKGAGAEGGNRGGDAGGGNNMKTIPKGDPKAFGANLADIASGKVEVR